MKKSRYPNPDFWIRRVLVVHPYGLGDLLFVTPVLRALRLLPTVERIDLLLGSRSGEVVRENPHVDEIMIIDKDRLHKQQWFQNCSEMLALVRRLRRNQYDLLLDYSLRDEYAFAARYLLGIPRQVGFRYKNRGLFHSVTLPIGRGFSDRHVVDYYCDLAERTGVRVEDRFLEFYLAEDDRRQAHKILKDKGLSGASYAVIGPGGGESWGKDAYFKRWPPIFFVRFLEQLKHKTGLDHFVLVGSGTEFSLAEEIARDLKGSCTVVNLAGKTGFATSAGLIEAASLFIGNDSGLVHLAHALRIPLIAFYGPVDPAIYGPYPPRSTAMAIYKKGLECRPCYLNFHYRSDCPHRHCLTALSPEEVWEQLAERQFFEQVVLTRVSG